MKYEVEKDEGFLMSSEMSYWWESCSILRQLIDEMWWFYMLLVGAQIQNARGSDSEV